mmetsp:Transcript_111972/g.222561  ORF Transcript_111972/g.222561 Transcript_111972/m.222561 type:complete len:90 (+) Transcript_111972:269-538(+)
MEMPHSLWLQQSIALPAKNVATTNAVETKEDKSLNTAATEVTPSVSGAYRHKQGTQPRDKYEQHTCFQAIDCSHYSIFVFVLDLCFILQ